MFTTEACTKLVGNSYTLLWTIEDFDLCSQKGSITSPPFPHNTEKVDEQWHVEFRPHNLKFRKQYDEDSQDDKNSSYGHSHAGLFLTLIDAELEGEREVYMRFSVERDESKTPTNTRKQKETLVKTKAQNYKVGVSRGFSNFACLNQIKKFVVDNKVVIKCEVYVLKTANGCLTPSPSSPSTFSPNVSSTTSTPTREDLTHLFQHPPAPLKNKN